MAIILGLITAICFGSGDFFGGLSTKKTSVLNVVAFSHLVGLISVVIIAPFIADAFAWSDVGIGALAGILGGLGVVGLYRGLATGPMAVVAPLTAIASAAFPAIWGTLSGESLTGLAWLGIFIALIAIGLSSLPGRPASGSGASRSVGTVTVRTIAESLAAGVGFGAMFILFDLTTDDVAPWPVVGARATTSTALLLFLFARAISSRNRDAGSDAGTDGGGVAGVFTSIRPALWLTVATGLFDTGSNVIFLIATTLGDLTVVAVLSSLYPVSTVILARMVLNERMSTSQLTGLALALVATVMIALG